jgi:TNF receptor-associated protein 1
MISNLGTIARSGSKAFVKNLKEGEGAADNIIGQFGVGFYSTFMVADRVDVFSQYGVLKDGVKAPSHFWSSDGSGEYEISEAEGVDRGTKVVIRLKKEAKEFTGSLVVKSIIQKYSNFVGFPIYLNGERVASVGALWTKSKDSITESEHTEFYKFITNAYTGYTYRMHYTTDVPLAINALFYFPESHTEKFGMGRADPGISLYSRKVLIQAKCKDLLPEYLRFVKGVVDSEEIPLNISRENMQNSALMAKINTILTKRVIRTLDEQARKDPVKYNTWFNEFGNFIKEGVVRDFSNKGDLAKLLRYQTSASDVPISLDEYIGRMKPDQSGIYYLSAPSRAFAESSPYMEAFKARGIEVVYLYQDVDDFVMTNMADYQTRKLLSAASERAKLDDKETKDDTTSMSPSDKTSLEAFIKTALKDKVSSVKFSNRLVSSPAIVVDHESAAMRKMMKMVDQQAGTHSELGKQKLEVNPDHPIIKNLFMAKDSDPELAKMVIEQVFDNALIAADILDSPRTMLQRINSILEASLKRAGVSGVKTAEEIVEPSKTS